MPASDVDLKQPVFTCRHVLDEGAPILQALRDEQGDLQLLCGEEAHADGEGRVMRLGDAIMEHPSIVDVMDLEARQLAYRVDRDEPWKIVAR